MSPDLRPGRPWRAALGVFVALALALGLVAAFAVGLGMRHEAERAGEPLARSADALAARIDPADLRAARAALAGAGAPARLLGPAGRVRAEAGGPVSAWAVGAAPWPGALATAGVAGWSLRDGAVEASRTLPSGAAIVLRRPLASGAATAGEELWPLGALVGLLAVLGAAAAWVLAARAGARKRAVAAAAEVTAAGRPAPVAEVGRGDMRRLSRAVGALTARAAELQDAAEARVEALGAVLGPMDHPAAARTPAGSLIRNEALERLVRDAAPGDASAIEEAVQAGLESSGPVSRRLSLEDGRDLEVDAWGVPGGRVVTVGERTEQARLAALRRQITGAAARHLQAPVSEVQAIGSDLLGQVPAASAPAVRRMLAAGDRMERLVGQILRGTEQRPARPPGADGLRRRRRHRLRPRDRLRREAARPRPAPRDRPAGDAAPAAHRLGPRARDPLRAASPTPRPSRPAAARSPWPGGRCRAAGSRLASRHRARHRGPRAGGGRGALRARRRGDRLPGRRPRAGRRPGAGGAAGRAAHARARPRGARPPRAPGRARAAAGARARRAGHRGGSDISMKIAPGAPKTSRPRTQRRRRASRNP